MRKLQRKVDNSHLLQHSQHQNDVYFLNLFCMSDDEFQRFYENLPIFFLFEFIHHVTNALYNYFILFTTLNVM